MTELHLPVMAAERQYLLTRRDGVYVDATVGDGGMLRNRQLCWMKTDY